MWVARQPLILLAAALAVSAARAEEVPAVVIQLAESYAASRTDAEQMPPGRTVTDEYATWFFQGYTHPNGGIWTKSNGARLTGLLTSTSSSQGGYLCSIVRSATTRQRCGSRVAIPMPQNPSSGRTETRRGSGHINHSK